MKKIAILLLLPVICLYAQSAMAKWPDRPIHLYVLNSPGGGSDIFCRTVAAAMEKELGVKIIVSNMPGGQGLTGMNYVWSRPHDGYTLSSISHGFMGLSAVAKTSLKPVDWSYCIGAGSPFVLAAAKRTGINSLEGFIAEARKRPLKVAVAGLDISRWQTGHLGKELNLVGVPYNGGGPALLGATSGDADLVWLGVGDLVQYLRNGDLLPIAVSTQNAPLKVLDFEMPPLADKFGEFKRYDRLGAFQGIMFPRDVPEDVKEKINTAFSRAMHSEKVREYLERQHLDLLDLTGEKALKLVEDYDATMIGLIKEYGKDVQKD